MSEIYLVKCGYGPLKEKACVVDVYLSKPGAQKRLDREALQYDENGLNKITGLQYWMEDRTAKRDTTV